MYSLDRIGKTMPTGGRMIPYLIMRIIPPLQRHIYGERDCKRLQPSSPPFGKTAICSQHLEHLWPDSHLETVTEFSLRKDSYKPPKSNVYLEMPSESENVFDLDKSSDREHTKNPRVCSSLRLTGKISLN